MHSRSRSSPLNRQDKWSLQQKWRESFSKGVKDATGKWSHDGPDWSTFSAGHTASLRGYRAESAYAGAGAESVILLSSNSAIPVYRCSAKPLLEDIQQFIIKERWLYDCKYSPLTSAGQWSLCTRKSWAPSSQQRLPDLHSPARTDAVTYPLGGASFGPLKLPSIAPKIPCVTLFVSTRYG